MEKYEKHGLTRMEDNILGAFGHLLAEEGKPTDFVHPDMIDVPPHKRPDLIKAVQELVRRGYLRPTKDNFGNEIYYLTPKGNALWKVRAKEEEEGPTS